MSIDSKQLANLAKIYKEAVYGGAKKEAPKDTRLVVTAADKKANTKAVSYTHLTLPTSDLV